MAFHVRDPETDALVRMLARRRSVGITAAIKEVVTRELESEDRAAHSRLEAIRGLRAELAKLPRTGLEADRDFYDSLNDE